MSPISFLFGTAACQQNGAVSFANICRHIAVAVDSFQQFPTHLSGLMLKNSEMWPSARVKQCSSLQAETWFTIFC
jgi:hypothetical protein